MQLRVRVLGAVALVVAAVLALSACSGSSGSSGTADDPGSGSRGSPGATDSADAQRACDAVTTRLLASVQSYVDRYGATLGGNPNSSGSRSTPPSTPAGTGDDAELRSSLQRAQKELDSKKCDLAAFRTSFAAGLDKVTAKGPLARAVLLRLTASMTGRLASSPTTISVAPSGDLAREVAALAPGSTVTLRAGRYVLRQPLVLLAGITLRGAGRERTTLSSRAAGTLILVLNDGRTELRDLAVRHTGRRPASVLVGGPGSSVVLTGARVSGGFSRKGSNDGQSGMGVLMTAHAADTTRRGTTLQVTRTQISDNTVAGLLLSGAHRASVRSTTFRANGQCGVCFGGKSSGGVQRGTFRDNAVGVAVLDEATPTLVDNEFNGGQVAIQVSGRAAPTVRSARIDGTSRAGLIFGDRSSGRVDGARCRNITYGIVVSPQALPFIGRGNTCPVAQGR